MSIRTCCRILPTILKHASDKHTNILHYSVFHGNNGRIVISSSVRFLQKINFYSTEENKTPGKSPESFQIYYGVLTPQIRAVKVFSLITSFTGLAAQPFIFKDLMAIESMPLLFAACSFVGFFTLVTPFLLHLITKKYVSKLVYKPKTMTYVATTYNLFNMSQEIEFTVDDVKIPEVPGMFTSFVVKDKPLFVDPRLFDEPTFYGKLMGYDKPLDLKLYQTSLNEKKD